MERISGDCPLGSTCEQVVDTTEGQKLKVCPWFTKIRGADPQTGEEIEEYRCAIAWMPVLLVEGSMFQRQTGAAVESFRNTMVKQNSMMTAALLERNKDPKLIEDTDEKPID